jgi:hypothetical protein
VQLKYYRMDMEVLIEHSQIKIGLHARLQEVISGGS